MSKSTPAGIIAYKIAVLVYIFNDAGELLLLHRKRPPNQDLYSPIGGKLEQGIGESPYACALREIEEEVGLTLTLDDIRLLGIVSERAFPGGGGEGLAAHWLMFCFEVTRRMNFPARQIEEGRLEWVTLEEMERLSIPKTDREVIWPLVRQYSKLLGGEKVKLPGVASDVEGAENGFFSVHIDCTDAEDFVVTQEHPRG